MTDKTVMLRDLDAAWDDLQAVLGSLDEIEMQQPGITGDWSVSDLLGHMAFWARRSAEALRLLAAGRESEIEAPANEQELDAWNAREAAGRGGLTPAETLAECTRSHQAARSALAAADPERLGIEVKGWTTAHRFAEDTSRHYREHAEQIRAWQRQLETTEA
jgi:hypothetical protein